MNKKCQKCGAIMKDDEPLRCMNGHLVCDMKSGIDKIKANNKNKRGEK